MGNFRIVINAVGDHGQDRGKSSGDTVNFYAGGNTTPDALAKSLTEFLRWNGCILQSAEIIHWPDSETSVTDDLMTGIRNRNL
jgi:hypothetical protein